VFNRRLVGFVAGATMISLDRLNKRQEIKVEILARVVQGAEVKGADRIDPVGLGEPVPEAVMFKALYVGQREEEHPCGDCDGRCGSADKGYRR
jgi:hypothetical protein